jgi:hypothetical protein
VLSVEPDVFATIAVKYAIDHDPQPTLTYGCRTGAIATNDRVGDILGQLEFQHRCEPELEFLSNPPVIARIREFIPIRVRTPFVHRPFSGVPPIPGRESPATMRVSIAWFADGRSQHSKKPMTVNC